MSYKGIDSVIEVIKPLVGFSWLTDSFGLADRIVEMRNDKPFIYPAIFSTGSDPVSMMPSDTYNAFSFWTKGTDAKVISTDLKIPILKYPVSLIFYMTLPTGDWKDTKSNRLQDIIDLFSTIHVPCLLEMIKIVEDDITKVYDGFSLDQIDNKFKIYPKWCIRVDMDITFRYDCSDTRTKADNTTVKSDTTVIHA